MSSSADASPALSRGISLGSNLWLDQDDALDRIAERLRAGRISQEQAEMLAHFAEHGYVLFPLDVDDGVFKGFLAGIDRLWKERPPDVSFARDSPARPMTEADESRDRKTRYRINDPHSHSEEALELYLNRRIFDRVELILGEEAVAIQSIFFEYGSEQLLHRDPVVVRTSAPGHLLAAWIALEDIAPECGPLVYVPGSHRLPFLELAPGRYMLDRATMGDKEIRQVVAFEDYHCERMGLKPRRFTPKKGEVLIWHASLRHGGAPVEDERLTRKSFVVHYTTRRTYAPRSTTIVERTRSDDGHWAERPRLFETGELVGRNGCYGIDNPLRGYRGH